MIAGAERGIHRFCPLRITLGNAPPKALFRACSQRPLVGATLLKYLLLEVNMRGLLILPTITAMAALQIGCGTLSSYNNGCSGVYSGVRTDVEYLGEYHEFRDGWDYATVAMDIPLSSVLDTVALPATAFIKTRSQHTLGCEWAGREQVAVHPMYRR